jgi:hypothetical protein
LNTQAGQSMTEFAVGAAVFALLLLGSITIAGYQEVQRRMAIAARQAAFTGAWAGGNANYAESLRRVAQRHLDDPALVDAFGRNPYVTGSAITAAVSLHGSPRLSSAAMRAMITPLRTVGSFMGGDFDLSADKLLQGALTVPIAGQPALPQPFGSLSLEFRQPVAIMIDAWNAASVDHVRSRSRGLVPTSALTGVQAIWRPLAVPISLLEPALRELCLGLIEPDRVPEDRLSAGRSPLLVGCP